jgi:hypothetical protein
MAKIRLSVAPGVRCATLAPSGAMITLAITIHRTAGKYTKPTL